MKKAFTLIELLVVIAICGIIAGLTIPAFKNIAKEQTTIGSVTLPSDLKMSRQLAISGHQNVYVFFVTSNLLNDKTFMRFNQLGIHKTNTVLGSYSVQTLGRIGDQPGKHEWYNVSKWIAPETRMVNPSILDSNNPPLIIQGQSIDNMPQYPYVMTDANNNLITNYIPAVQFNFQGRVGQTINMPLVECWKDTKSMNVQITDYLTNLNYSIIQVDGNTGLTRVQEYKIK